MHICLGNSFTLPPPQILSPLSPFSLSANEHTFLFQKEIRNNQKRISRDLQHHVCSSALYSHILPFHLNEISVLLLKAHPSTCAGGAIPSHLLSAPAMSPLCCFQRQICMPLHYSLHHTTILLFLPSKTTTTNFY